MILHVCMLTMFSSKITIFGSDILEDPCGWIFDLNIAGYILVTVHFAETVEGLVSNLGDVELMIS